MLTEVENTIADVVVNSKMREAEIKTACSVQKSLDVLVMIEEIRPQAIS